MKISDLRRSVKNKFAIGQKVTLQMNDPERYGGDEITVKILAFYPDFILAETKEYKICFRYHEFLSATVGIEEIFLKCEAIGWHRNIIAS